MLNEIPAMENDKDLYDFVSAIVSVPKKPSSDFGDNSFILHAPLELSARFFLLPLVDDGKRDKAISQIEAIAHRYSSFEDLNEINTSPDPMLEFNVENCDIALWSSSLLFASHNSILLAMKLNLGETNAHINQILFRMDNEIKFDADAQMNWPKNTEHSPTNIKDLNDFYFANLANIAVDDIAQGTIRGLIEKVENSGLTFSMLNQIPNKDFDQQFVILQRISALAMLTEDDEHSKFGWTHCFTIPHAIWALSQYSENKMHLLKSAITHVASYRHTQSKQKLRAEDLNEYFEEDETSVFAEHYVRITDIISRASVLEDAHLVKYAYSNFDLMKRDPQYSKLYLAASAKLLDIWEKEVL